jgi:hypothetical protein
MKHNLGSADRAIRAFVIAPIALILAFLTGAGSVLGVILIVVAVVMAVTAAVGFCPLYRLVGLSSCPMDRRQAHG